GFAVGGGFNATLDDQGHRLEAFGTGQGFITRLVGDVGTGLIDLRFAHGLHKLVPHANVPVPPVSGPLIPARLPTQFTQIPKDSLGGNFSAVDFKPGGSDTPLNNVNITVVGPNGPVTFSLDECISGSTFGGTLSGATRNGVHCSLSNGNGFAPSPTDN